jgi:hypothetical protein
MSGSRLSFVRGAILAAALVAVVAGCGCQGNIPTPTPLAPTPVVTPTPTLPTLPPPAVATAVPTLPPPVVKTPTPAPTPVPTPVPGAACSGNATNKAFFVDAVKDLSFDIYCAVLPSTWWVMGGNYTLPSGGKLTVYYTNAAGALIQIKEGAFCVGSSSVCGPMSSSLGTIAFGPLAGSFGSIMMPMPNASVPTYPFFVLYVHPGTTHAYQMIGTGMSQAQFKSWAAAIVKVG